MDKQTITFKIARDSEAKSLGNTREVTITVNFDGVPEETVVKAALQAQVVSWQGQIRSHWDDFVAGRLPDEVTFGNPLFEGRQTRTVIRQPTEKDVKEFIKAQLAAGKSLEEILGNI